MGDIDLHIASTLGMLLGVCLAARVFADLLHLPKVTAAETDDCIPVVTRDEHGELLGVVRRSDVVHAMITQHRKTK